MHEWNVIPANINKAPFALYFSFKNAKRGWNLKIMRSFQSMWCWWQSLYIDDTLKIMVTSADVNTPMILMTKPGEMVTNITTWYIMSAFCVTNIDVTKLTFCHKARFYRKSNAKDRNTSHTNGQCKRTFGIEPSRHNSFIWTWMDTILMIPIFYDAFVIIHVFWD